MAATKNFTPQNNAVPSSSPAFATPARPIRQPNITSVAFPSRPATVLPIALPPQALRPLAFRTFTKKHNLTLSSSALQVLATFIGKYCGSGWREDGLAENVLEEAARQWKRDGGHLIVDGEGEKLKIILRALECVMVGGRIRQGRSELSRESSFNVTEINQLRRPSAHRDDSQGSFGMSAMVVQDQEHDEEEHGDFRNHFKVIDAFNQPRLVYDVAKRHFDCVTSRPSLFPSAAHKTQLFRQRYHLIHQQLLRNETFQSQSISRGFSPHQAGNKITPLANLLGRSGSNHLILGFLTIAPAGTLAICDLTGSIGLDLTHAQPFHENGALLTPGMIVLVDGMYEEEHSVGVGLGNSSGVGGNIGGKFFGFRIGGPPCEKRAATLNNSGSASDGKLHLGGTLGWVDYLGVGSEKAVGAQMRRVEQRLLGSSTKTATKVVLLGEVNLDNPACLAALSKVLQTYTTSEGPSPISFILFGNFVSHAALSGTPDSGSIEYKEHFDALASILSEFPTLLRTSTFVFVPGDNDPWASAFSAGAATPLPRKGVPELFTLRTKRAFAAANAEAGTKGDGEAIWGTNPARLTLFGPTHEIVLFRDDISGRLRRNAIRLNVTSASHEHEQVQRSDTADQEALNSGTLPLQVHGADAVMDVDNEKPQSAAGGKTSKDSSTVSYSEVQMARTLAKTLCDQSYLSPFALSTRPVLWDYTASLYLYPLPTTLMLCDPEAPSFAVTYEGCHVVNVGRLVREVRGRMVGWVEYDVATKRGTIREEPF